MPKIPGAKPKVLLSATQCSGEAYVDTSHMTLLLFVLVKSKQDSESCLKKSAFYRFRLLRIEMLVLGNSLAATRPLEVVPQPRNAPGCRWQAKGGQRRYLCEYIYIYVYIHRYLYVRVFL